MDCPSESLQILRRKRVVAANVDFRGSFSGLEGHFRERRRGCGST